MGARKTQEPQDYALVFMDAIKYIYTRKWLHPKLETHITTSVYNPHVKVIRKYNKLETNMDIREHYTILAMSPLNVIKFMKLFEN